MSFFDLIAQLDRDVQEHLGGVPVIYRPELGEPVTVTGMFDVQYVLVQGFAEAGVEARGPAVFLQVADLPGDPVEDDIAITIGGIDYKVLGRKPDGVGGIVLALRTKVT